MNNYMKEMKKFNTIEKVADFIIKLSAILGVIGFLLVVGFVSSYDLEVEIGEAVEHNVWLIVIGFLLIILCAVITNMEDQCKGWLDAERRRLDYLHKKHKI